jgi:hypothetical protein
MAVHPTCKARSKEKEKEEKEKKRTSTKQSMPMQKRSHWRIARSDNQQD